MILEQKPFTPMKLTNKQKYEVARWANYWLSRHEKAMKEYERLEKNRQEDIRRCVERPVEWYVNYNKKNAEIRMDMIEGQMEFNAGLNLYENKIDDSVQIPDYLQ